MNLIDNNSNILQEQYTQLENQLKSILQPLPFIEDIYDLETNDLLSTLNKIQQLEQNLQHFQSQAPFLVDKYQRKILKLKQCIDLELRERQQVEEVISFFTSYKTSVNPFLGSDEEFDQYIKQQVLSPSKRSSEIKEEPEVLIEDGSYKPMQMQRGVKAKNRALLPPIPSQKRGYELPQSTNKKEKTLNPFMSEDDVSSQVSVPMSRHGSKRTMAQFMKNTLAQTRIQDNEYQITMSVQANAKRNNSQKKHMNKKKSIMDSGEVVIRKKQLSLKPTGRTKRSVVFNQKKPIQCLNINSPNMLSSTRSLVDTQQSYGFRNQSDVILTSITTPTKASEEKIVRFKNQKRESRSQNKQGGGQNSSLKINFKSSYQKDQQQSSELLLQNIQKKQNKIIEMNMQLAQQIECLTENKQQTPIPVFTKIKTEELKESGNFDKDEIKITTNNSSLSVSEILDQELPMKPQNQSQKSEILCQDHQIDEMSPIRDFEDEEQAKEEPQIINQIFFISQTNNNTYNRFRRDIVPLSTKRSQEENEKVVVVYEDGRWKRSRILDDIVKNSSVEKINDKSDNKNQIQQKGVNRVEKVVSGIGQSIVFDQGIVDYTRFYNCFNEIFLVPLLLKKSINGVRLVKQCRSVEQIMYDNCRLYTTFSQLLDMEEYTLPEHHQMIQGAQGSQSQKEFLQQQIMQEVKFRERYSQIKKLVSTINYGSDYQNNEFFVRKNKPSELYFRVVKEKAEVYDIITNVMDTQMNYQWKELPHGVELTHAWNLLWTWSKIKTPLESILVWQKFNHFPDNKNLTRKDLLKKCIEKVQKQSKQCKELFDIIPLTFYVPQEYGQLQQAYQISEKLEGKDQNVWIVKPPGKSRGRGIFLLNELSELQFSEPLIVQKYMKNPLLINGHKFDLRIYVLVTSFNPLEAFIYKEGFARFSTVPFSLDPQNRGNKLIHLTNYSIQKTQFNYNTDGNKQVISEDQKFNARTSGWIGSAVKSGCSGSKLSLSNLRAALTQKYISWDHEIWPQIREIVLKSLLAGSHQNQIPYNPSAFELYGYDIMIDSKKKCWLIEINSSPSLATETSLDENIKKSLIRDTFQLLNPLDFDRKRLSEVLSRRLGEQNKYKMNKSTQAQANYHMNKDLTYILDGQVPRPFGEVPGRLGNYEMVAPSSQTDKILKVLNMKEKNQQSQGLRLN